MKRFSIVMLAVVLLATIFIFAGCGKKVMNAYEFRTEMESRGFDIYTDDVNDSIEGISSAVSADNDDYELEFGQFDTAENAKKFFDMMYERMDSRVSEMNNLVSTKDYIHFDDGDDFYVVSLSENTIIACDADLRYRDEILGLLKDLGYGK